jgi:eukaryotic-like serine/threonine-protein kinase
MVFGGRYQLDTRIAAGGMGEVWRASDVVLGRQIAVKVLRSDVAERPGFLDRFRREARNLAMLSHPAIATLFDYGEHEGSPYLVMELVTGENLASRLHRDGPMPVNDVVDVVRRVAEGLAVAHEAGMVHRDIKPANLMITERGHVKITDFGISRLADSPTLTAATDVMGTPQYMSPEQISGQPTSPASDVYSLAVVAFEMLTGQPPFVADSPVAVALAQLHDLPPPLPTNVPDWFATLIGSSLAKTAVDRPADGHELVVALDRTQLTVPDDIAPLFSPTAPMSPADIVRSPGLLAASDLIGPLRRHRTKRLASVGLAAVAIAALVTAMLVARPGGTDSTLTIDPTVVSTPASASTTPASDVPAPVTTAPATTPPVTTRLVTVDPAAFVGRGQEQVVAELEALGLAVDVIAVDAERGTKKRTVIGVDPEGEVAPGTMIEVQVFQPNEKKGNDD